jgi:hypothetical protein
MVASMSPDEALADARDTALILIGWKAALRASDLAGMRIQDQNLAIDTLRCQPWSRRAVHSPTHWPRSSGLPSRRRVLPQRAGDELHACGCHGLGQFVQIVHGAGSEGVVVRLG